MALFFRRLTLPFQCWSKVVVLAVFRLIVLYLLFETDFHLLVSASDHQEMLAACTVRQATKSIISKIKLC